jgi:hypothetical protein
LTQAAFNAASCGSPPTQMNDTEGFGGSAVAAELSPKRRHKQPHAE